MSNEASNQDHSWLTQVSTDSEEVAKYYDDWAKAYNATLASWNYSAPVDAANLLKQYVPTDRRILDAGCGTGLSGQALHDAGCRDIIGIDISADSLVIAKQTNAYRHVQTQNLQHVPFPFEADSFDALTCIGVMTYVSEPIAVLREYCRLVSSGGHIVLTQRNDLFDSQDYPAMMAQLQEEGLWDMVSVSEPQPYLPNNEDFGDRILVIYIVARVL